MNGRLAPFVPISQPAQGLAYPFFCHTPKARHRLAKEGQGPAGPRDAKLDGGLSQVILYLLALNLSASPTPVLDGEGSHSLGQVALDPPPYAPALHRQELRHLAAGNPSTYVIDGQGLHPYVGHGTLSGQMVQFPLLFRRQLKLLSHMASLPQSRSNVTIFS